MTLTGITHNDIRVGPDGLGSYRYMIGGKLSERNYANAESAYYDARRPQRVTDNGTIVPEEREDL